MKLIKKPQIVIRRELYDSIMSLAKNQPLEWSLYAKTEKINKTSWQIVDLIVPFQENSSSATEIPTEASIDGKTFSPVFEWQTRDAKDLKDPSTWRNMKEWNCLIHSHNSMGVFWSATDWDEMEEMAKEREHPFISIVVNSKKEILIYIGIPEIGIEFNECSIKIIETATLKEFLAMEKPNQKIWTQYMKEEAVRKELLNGDLIDKTIKKVVVHNSSMGFHKGVQGKYNYYDNTDTWQDEMEDYYGFKKKQFIVKKDKKLFPRTFSLDIEEQTEIYNNLYYEIESEGDGYYVLSQSSGIAEEKVEKLNHLDKIQKEAMNEGNILAYLKLNKVTMEIYLHVYANKTKETPKSILNLKTNEKHSPETASILTA